MRTATTLIAAAIIGLAAAPALGGSLGPTAVTSTLEWRTNCTAPAQPTLFIDNIETYNLALEEFNTYVAQVRAYIQCIQSDGRGDVDALADVVARGMQAQQSVALEAVEELRTDLNVQRSLLR